MGSHNKNALIAKASLGLMLCVMFMRAQPSHALSLMDAYQAALTHEVVDRFSDRDKGIEVSPTPPASEYDFHSLTIPVLRLFVRCNI